MRILAIETSCDETAASVVENGTHVLSSVISSSKDAFLHAGGVIPEHAAREQLQCIHPVIDQALTQAATTYKDIDAIAVTRGPGLLVSLLVGTTVARTLASLWHKPLIGVHHTLGHLSSPWLDATEECIFPLLTLSASGGHTELWLRTTHTQGTLLGATRDDAAGEAFDKGALLLGLSYPGGPAIAALARNGDPHTFAFPSPLHDDPSLDFSFSGLKTALKYTMRDHPLSTEADREHLAASYQHAICAHLADRIARAQKAHPDLRELHLVGGVSANIYLRTLAGQTCETLPMRTPRTLAYCTDNAAMIGAAAFFLYEAYGHRAMAPFITAASSTKDDVFGV
ncbi:MAG: tRNA (adenosine(37)-N6)-threonylcarbamoyltransferase complex transferase subunit TsaD [Candidatus Peribacteraceae bacterium]|jgi:N6-L-threonylcarbamoyladenine synthase